MMMYFVSALISSGGEDPASLLPTFSRRYTGFRRIFSRYKLFLKLKLFYGFAEYRFLALCNGGFRDRGFISYTRRHN